MAPRAKIYEIMESFDKDLTATFEKLTNGNPNKKLKKADAQQIMDVLLKDGKITYSEGVVMDKILYEGKFDEDALGLMALKLQEAIKLHDAFLNAAIKIPTPSSMMEPITNMLGITNTAKIEFTSPGSKLAYNTNQYLTIKSMVYNGDIPLYQAVVGSFRHNPLINFTTAGTYTSDSNKLIYYDAYDQIENAITLVHEATHAIQDWLDVTSTVRFFEADAYIAGAVAAIALKQKRSYFPKTSPYVSAFDRAAPLVVKGKAKDPNDKAWAAAYKHVTDAVAKDPLYIGKIDDASPGVSDGLAKGATSELDRFNAVLKKVVAQNKSR
jgi:hypothetical protein